MAALTRRVRDLSVGARLATAFLLVCGLLSAVAGAGIWGAYRQNHGHAQEVRLRTLSAQVERVRFLENDVTAWIGYIWIEAVVNGSTSALDPNGGVTGPL